jgi:hypothetical protein
VAETGLLISVRWEWNGTELAVDAPIGATSLTVLDAEALSNAEVFYVGDSGPYAADAVSGNVVGITPALTVACEEGEPVAPDAGGEPSRVWLAEVLMPDAEKPIEVMLTATDLLSMPEGEYDPRRPILLSDDLASVVDPRPGGSPSLDGGLIDPDTFPDGIGGGTPMPTAPPETSPGLAVSSSTRGVTAYALGQPPDIHTVLTYEVATDAAFGSVILTVPTRQTVATLAPLPPRTDLWVRVTASNDLGPATGGPGPAVGPVRTVTIEPIDIADLSLTADKFNTSTHVLF